MKSMRSQYIRILAGALVVLTAEVATADVLTLQPVDDAYLSNSGGEADLTYNTADLEQLGYFSSIKRPLLKFDLSSIPDGATVVSAQLTLQLAGVSGGDMHYTSVWRMTNDNWAEETATWNSYSQTGAIALAILPPTTHTGVRAWDMRMTDWAYAEDLLDNAVTLMMRWDDSAPNRYETDGYYKWNTYSSKEGTVAPTLRIEYTPDPSAPPRLTISQTNALITVSWPATAADWLLERTNVLSGASAPWPTVPPPYETNGGTISVAFTNAPAVENQFFRLHKP
jgi:hypothetical protein